MKKVLIKFMVLFMVAFVLYATGKMDVKAATVSDMEKIKVMMSNLIVNGSSTPIDLSAYKLTYADANNILLSVKKDPDTIVYCNAIDNLGFDYTLSGGYIKTLYFSFPADYMTRVNNLQTVVNVALDGMDDKMTNLDKVLYIHDFLCYVSSYDLSATVASGNVYSTLALGKGICGGYTNAMIMFMDMFGIKTVRINGNGSSHVWLQVEIDGQYYHVDATWDDPYTEVAGRVLHKNFMLNDSEIKATGHYSWTEARKITVGTTVYTIPKDFVISTSTKYSGWFVKNVSGRMLYKDGSWTYVDKNKDIVRISSENLKTDLSGSSATTIVEGDVQAVDKYEEYLIYSTGREIYASKMDGTDQVKILEVENLVTGKTTRIDYLKVVGDELTYTAYNYTVENGLYTYSSKNAYVVNLRDYKLEPEPVKLMARPSVVPSLSTVDFSDFTNWKTGLYDWITAKYIDYPSRISLFDYIKADSSMKYQVKIGNRSFSILIRELDADKKFLGTTILADGQSFTTKANTQYVAVSLYNPNNSALRFTDYENLFSTGFLVEFTNTITSVQPTATAVQPTVTTVQSIVTTATTVNTELQKSTDIADTNLSSIQNWRTGLYNWYNGQYMSYSSRICLNDYKTFQSGATYQFTISNSAYKLLIRELDANNKFLRTTTVSSGNSFKPGSDANYLAVSLYNPSNESIAFSDYQNLFNTGFSITIK